MKKLLLLLLLTLPIIAKQIIVTGVDVTYECKETEHGKYYSMGFWAEGCPYPSGESLHEELLRRGFLDGPPPPCEAPQEPLPAPFPATLGEHFIIGVRR